MKTLKFETKEEWLLARRGKITGSRLKDIVVKRGTGKKIGFYELIAERLSVPTEENALEHGVNCEPEAIARLEEALGKKFDKSLVIWERENNSGIAVSPDGFSGLTIAAEAKCLSSANHIKAWLTQEVPDEYELQTIQYFIVNDKLKKLYVAFYDPRIPAKDFFFLEINRKDVQPKIDEYLKYQEEVLKEVEDIVNNLTF